MKGNFILIIGILLLLNVNFIAAHGEETFSQAEDIIKQKISCDDLSDDQLEILGDYYMEQMHPGEAHELMDEMMGGEGSDSLRQIHINMGNAFYCGEHEKFSGGMMDMMMGRNMMNSGGMMGSYYNSSQNNYTWMILNWIVIIALVLLIVWLLKQITKSKKRKK